MPLERRFSPTRATIETRADGSRVITGYAAVFYRKDDPGTEYELWDGVVERIQPGAFDTAITEKQDVRGLYNHNPDHLLGRTSAGTMTLSTDKTGLRYDIPLDENDPDHQRVASKLERGDLTGSSFAFIPTEVRWIDAEDDEPEVREIVRVNLFDAGPVTFPAYTGTSAGLRSVGTDDEARREYDAWKDGKRQEAEAVAVRLRLLEITERG